MKAVRKASWIAYLVGGILNLLASIGFGIAGLIIMISGGIAGWGIANHSVTTSSENIDPEAAGTAISAVTAAWGIVFLVFTVFGIVATVLSFKNRTKVQQNTDTIKDHVLAIVFGALGGVDYVTIAGAVLALVSYHRIRGDDGATTVHVEEAKK